MVSVDCAKSAIFHCYAEYLISESHYAVLWHLGQSDIKRFSKILMHNIRNLRTIKKSFEVNSLFFVSLIILVSWDKILQS
jgi:hypothetical protein